MKKLLYLFLLLGLLSCSASRKTTVNNNTGKDASIAVLTDGLSYQSAIVIDAKSETTGVAKEYEWLKQQYPGYKLQKQSLNYQGKKVYDVMKIKTEAGEDLEIYFDITKFFGKF